jgi:transcriptional antiterminator NusG
MGSENELITDGELDRETPVGEDGADDAHDDVVGKSSSAGGKAGSRTGDETGLLSGMAKAENDSSAIEEGTGVDSIGDVGDANAGPVDGTELGDDEVLDDEWVEGVDDWEPESQDENASPIEEFVEEVEIDSTLEKKWYILKVQVNREDSICDALRRRVSQAGYDDYFGEILVPTEDVREFSKSGKQKVVKRKLYPGYVVVNMAVNDNTWFLVRETPGIGDFTGAAGKPVPLKNEEIERIIASTRPVETEDGAEPTIKTAIKFKVGDRVRVKEGYFQNYEGEVSNIDERNGRVTVMINIFGRPNPVELDHWQMESM